MGFVPQVVDINGDGLTDIISGSYWGDPPRGEGQPGQYKDEKGNPLSEIFVYYSHPDGSFAPRQRLAMSHVHSVASPVDWDGDGDYDLITADRSKRGICLMLNIGSKTEPKFEAPKALIPNLPENVAKDLMITSAEAIDWDQDGLLDLIAGTEWGQIIWFRNLGRSESPKLSNEPQFLIGKTTVGMDHGEKRDLLEKHPWGSRLALFVFDWDGDGVLDVIAGDAHSKDITSERLSAEEYAVYKEAQAKVNEYSSKLSELYPKDTKIDKLSEEEIQSIRKASQELRAEYAEFLQKAGKMRVVEHHGYVWVFRGIKN